MNKTKRRFLASFSVFDIIFIAMCAGLGVAVKPLIVPLVHIVTGPLLIPGGAMAGGFYMLFVVLPAGLTRKHGAVTLSCAVQAILVIITGVMGSHGVMSLVTYLLPGVLVDAFLLIVRKQGMNAAICFFSVMIANVSGSFLSNLLFFRLPFIPLMLMLFSAALSGGLGGLIAWGIIKKLRQYITIFGQKHKGGNDE